MTQDGVVDGLHPSFSPAPIIDAFGGGVVE